MTSGVLACLGSLCMAAVAILVGRTPRQSIAIFAFLTLGVMLLSIAMGSVGSA